jgi:glycosyltransferase involved in cell wall biosynthesis
MSVSVAIICRNSSDVIERCLESVKDSDEIVVVDTGSDDNTIELARKYTDKVFEYWGCNEGGKKDGLFANFADARNKALEYCTKTHIFTIDTDEELHPGGMDEMKKFKGVSLSVKCISSVSGEIHRQPRLYLRHPKIFWQGAAHNYLNCSSGIMSEVTITYHPNQQKKRDPDRTMRILERWVKEHPKDSAREIYYLAKEYFKRQWWKKAIKTFQKYVTQSKFEAELADAFLFLARCYVGTKEYKEATNACLAAININPEFEEAINLAGELSGNTNRLKWKHLAANANNAGVLFIRPDKRLKVTVLSKWDWAGSGYRIVKAVRRASQGHIDIEAITEFEGQGTDKYFIPTGPGVGRIGREVAQSRIDKSDIIHFKGDWPVNGEFAGVTIPERKRVYTVSGSLFRFPGEGLTPDVSRGKFKLEDFKADYLSAITPDLCYTPDWNWMGHCNDHFDYKWKQGSKFRVLHVPSDPKKKGTDLIIEAIKLLNRPDVEFICESGIPYNEMLELKKTAHLYIDQMVIWVYSLASVEAMSYGVPVFSGINPALYPDGCPVVYPRERTAQSIANELNTILDWSVLREHSERSFEWCKNIHGQMGEKWVKVYRELTK